MPGGLNGVELQWTILSIYNPGPFCAEHEMKKAPRLVGERPPRGEELPLCGRGDFGSQRGSRLASSTWCRLGAWPTRGHIRWLL